MDKKIIGIGSAALLFIIFFIFLFLQNLSLKKNLKQMDQRLQTEANMNRSDMETLNLHLIQTLQASNDLRRMLGMPVVAFESNEESNSENSVDSELSELKKVDVFYSAVDLLKKTEDSYALSGRFNSFLQESGLIAGINERNLLLRQTTSITCNIQSDSGLLYTLEWDEGTAFSVSDSKGSSMGSLSVGDFLTQLDQTLAEIKIIAERTNKLSSYLRYSLLQSSRVKAALEDKHFKTSFETNSTPVLIIHKADYSEAARIAVDSSTGSIILDNNPYQDTGKLQEAFNLYIETLDHRTEVQIRDDEAVALIDAALADSTFIEYLSERGYEISTTPREILHGDYRYWDLSRNGQIVGSFALLIGFGELYLLDEDGLPIQSFRGFTEDHRIIGDSSYEYTDDFQVLTDLYNSKSSETYLFIGTHEKNADTMILAHANLDTGKTQLISIPRDLWYNSRKINSVYRYYGPEALVRELSELTGLQIDHYISVDMYAFIDIIDIMGGVDIILNEALIDPNHKIKENGQWTTLHYPAGPVHLDGVGALRVARSRHTTNDFERAKRQQNIINAMKEKALNMAITDLDALSKFISAAFEYTDSNMGPAEMLRAFLKYKDTDIEMGNVIDNTNILYTSYSNLYQLDEEEQNRIREEEPEFNKGAWIVLPKNNDWNLIKWYIREMINPQNPLPAS